MENPFVATLYNVLLAPHLCDQLFSIIMLMNLGHTCLFHNGFGTFFFSDNKQSTVKLPHSAQRKHASLVKRKEKSKSQKNPPHQFFSLELLHHRLGHSSTSLLLVGYTTNVWQDIEFWIDIDQFCTSCQISIINKKSRSKSPLKLKIYFKWVLMEIIPDTYLRHLKKTVILRIISQL